MQKLLIVILVTIILVLMFALQNPGEAELKFAFWEFTTPPALIVLVSVFLGIIIGMAFVYPTIRKRNKKIDKLSNNLQEFRTKERDNVEEETKHTNKEDHF